MWGQPNSVRANTRTTVKRGQLLMWGQPNSIGSAKGNGTMSAKIWETRYTMNAVV